MAEFQTLVGFNGTAITINRALLTVMPSAFVSLPIPDHLYFFAGRVVLSWSLVEDRLDQLLDALVKGNGPPEPTGYKTLKGKKRRLLLLAQCRKAFASHPNVIACIEKLCAAAANIFWMRNVLVHGHILVGFGVDCAALRVTGEHNRKDVTIEFDADLLQSLHLDMGHIAMCIELLERAPGTIFPDLSSQDIDALQNFLAKNIVHRPLENPPDPLPIQSIS